MATDKVQILVQLIARLRVGRLSDESIAQRLGLSRSGLSRILGTPEYKSAQSEALKEATDHLDELLKARTDYIAQEFAREAVPEAMRSLVYAVKQKRDLRACIVAAKEILDRDPNRTLVPRNGGNGTGIALREGQGLPDAIFARTMKEANLLAGETPITVTVVPMPAAPAKEPSNGDSRQQQPSVGGLRQGLQDTSSTVP